MRTLWLYLVISSLFWPYFKIFFPIKCVPTSHDKKVLKLKKTKVCQNPNWKKEKFAWSYKLEFEK